MITGEGFIGKLIYFLVTKLAGKKMDLLLDDRKRTCRAFTELYFCLERLEDITDKFIIQLDSSIQTGNAIGLINEVLVQEHAIETVSNRFFSIGAELERAIDLFDPVLSRSVSQIFGLKFSFLFFISKSIELKNESLNNILEYKNPSPKVLDINLDSYYEWLQNHPNNTDMIAKEIDWPVNFIKYSDFDSLYDYKVIRIHDIQELIKLRDIIDLHFQELTKARERLREFIISQFKIDEVLYVSKGLERYEF